MILTRIRERVRAQDWFAVTVELLIVVLGVFFGIQVANWNTERVERETGRVYRQRILDDLNSNAADIEMRVRYYHQVRAHALAALAVVRAPDRPAGEQFLIDLYEATQVVPRVLKRNTWEEVLSTGAMNVIGSPGRREMISNYYQSADTVEFTLRSVTPYRAWMRSRMPYDIQRRVRERCPEIIQIDARFNVAARLAENCTLGLPPARIAEVAAKLRADPELEGHLNSALTDLDQKIAIGNGFRNNTNAEIAKAWRREVD